MEDQEHHESASVHDVDLDLPSLSRSSSSNDSSNGNELGSDPNHPEDHGSFDERGDDANGNGETVNLSEADGWPDLSPPEPRRISGRSHSNQLFTRTPSLRHQRTMSHAPAHARKRSLYGQSGQRPDTDSSSSAALNVRVNTRPQHARDDSTGSVNSATGETRLRHRVDSSISEESSVSMERKDTGTTQGTYEEISLESYLSGLSNLPRHRTGTERTSVEQLQASLLSQNESTDALKEGVTLYDVKARLQVVDLNTYQELAKQADDLASIKSTISPDQVTEYNLVAEHLEFRMRNIALRIQMGYTMLKHYSEEKRKQKAARAQKEKQLKAKNDVPTAPSEHSIDSFDTLSVSSNETDVDLMNKSKLAHARRLPDTMVLKRQSKRLDVLESGAVERAEHVLQHFGKVTAKLERLKTDRRLLHPKGIFRHPHLVQRPQLKQYWKDEETILVREDKEHKASWNELFFDLIFVVVFSQLGHALETDASVRGFCQFAVLFTATWHMWASANMYINRFNPDDAFHKCYYFLEMLCVLGLITHTTKGVVIAYLCGRGVTEVFNAWAAFHEYRVRRSVYASWVVSAFSSIPWLVSLAFEAEPSEPHGILGCVAAHDRPSETHLWLWALGLGIELLGHVIVGSVKGVRLPLNVEHVTERFGLFTIIMLGEDIVALVFHHSEATPQTYIMAVFGSLIVFNFQVFYFDVEAGKQTQHALLSERVIVGQIWYLTHLFLQMSITTVAAGTKLLNSETLSTPHESDLEFIKWMYCVGQFVSFVSLSVIGLTHIGPKHTLVDKAHRISLRLAVGVIILILPAFGSGLSVVALAGTAAFLGTVAALVELYGGIPPHSVAQTTKELKVPKDYKSVNFSSADSYDSIRLQDHVPKDNDHGRTNSGGHISVITALDSMADLSRLASTPSQPRAQTFMEDIQEDIQE